ELDDIIKKDDKLKEITAKEKAVLRVLKAKREQQKLITDDLIRQESSLKSLSAELAPLVKMDRERLRLQETQKNISAETAQAFNNIADLNQQLAELSAEDSVSRAIIKDQIEQELKKLEGKQGVEKEIVDNLTQQYGIADQYSKLTEEQKEQLKAQVEAYNDIKKTIGGILGTAGLLFSGWRGFLRIGLFGAGKALTALGKTTREFGGYLGGATISATALGFAFDDAEDVAKGLSAEMGGLNDVSFANQLNTNLMATNMGISGDEAAKLTGNLARLNGLSIENAQNMADGAKEMAKTAGVIPSAVMADMAASAEEFALFGKEGGANLAKAAVQAAKMGVSLKTMSGIADNLLDFESSINQEMELGAMLGKNINLDRARALAYEGDLAGATQETLNALGGVEAFNQMDYFQKKKTAELLGTSVEELQKMVTQQEEAATLGGKINGAFNTATEALTAITTGPLGGFVSGLSGAIGTTKEIAGNFKEAGGFLSGMASKVKGMFGAKTPSAPGGATTPAPTTPAPQTQAGPADQANKMSKVKASDLIKGAVALLILAAALFVAAKAFQEFGEVTWESVAMGLVALVGLAGIAFLLGKMQGEMIKGAIAVAILGAALIPFAFALTMMSQVDANGLIASGIALVAFTAAVFGLGALLAGPGAIIFGLGIIGFLALGAALIVLGTGLLMVGTGMAALTSAFPAVLETISQMAQIDFLPIIGLAASLMILSAALAAVAVTGLLALPVLMALGVIGGAEGIGGGGDKDGDAKMDELIGEIKALRGDLLSGKIGVNMDGQKVTSKVSSVVSKVGSNSYAKV
ncbi:MAG: hypothetical protein RLZ52_582, partial [Pseudomonadota bacterium]